MQRRFAEQRFGALLLQGCQSPQQGLAGACGHQRTVFTEQLRVVLQVRQQGLEVLDIQQQQAFAVGDLERGIQCGLLAVGQLQQITQQ
ncbi:hypothetical protein D9M71_437640 [compost metagenome]